MPQLSMSEQQLDRVSSPLRHGCAVPPLPWGEASVLRTIFFRLLRPGCSEYRCTSDEAHKALLLWGGCPVRTLGGWGRLALPARHQFMLKNTDKTKNPPLSEWVSCLFHDRETTFPVRNPLRAGARRYLLSARESDFSWASCRSSMIRLDTRKPSGVRRQRSLAKRTRPYF